MIDIDYLEHLASAARGDNDGVQTVQLGGIDFDIKEFLQKLDHTLETLTDEQDHTSSAYADKQEKEE